MSEKTFHAKKPLFDASEVKAMAAEEKAVGKLRFGKFHPKAKEAARKAREADLKAG